MSANRWSECPKCIKLRENMVEKYYGKIPSAEYLRKMKEAPKQQDTLREDWEIYIDGDYLHMIYGCSCDKCKFEFKTEQIFELLTGEKK